MYKLIAVDLDDTLLKDDLTISDINKKAIKQAIEKGIIFTIATGRVTSAAIKYAKELNLQVPIITYQGASIYDINKDEEIHSNFLKFDKACRIIELAEKNNIHCNIYDEENVYVNKENKWSEYYRKLSKGLNMKVVENLKTLELTTTPKLILIDEVENINNIRTMVEELALDDINIFTSKPNFLEITSKKATKKDALEYLASMYDIKREDIIAIGDSFNDLSMIDWAGLGVCMENGKQHIKEKANYITATNEENGVAKVIKEFIF